MIMRKMTTIVSGSIVTGAMAILISGCSSNSAIQSTKGTSTYADTQAVSSENTTSANITTTADDSAESVTSIKKDGYLAIPIADLSQTASFDQVGIASGGCNPWPILDSDRTVTNDEIQISYNVLKATADELPKFFQ